MVALSLSRMSLKRLSHDERRRLGIGLLFVSPWIIGFFLWTLFPLVSSFYFSLARYNLLRPPEFIGFRNYELLFQNSDFHLVLQNTLWWVILSAPLGVLSAFLIANLLNSKIVGRPFFRAIFFFPSIVPAVVIAFVWQFLLNQQYGAFNAVLKSWGMQAIPFLSNPDWVKPTIVSVHMWAQGGAMVIFLAALQDVPRELYEAATVDGANRWNKFRHITVPMTSPVILFNLVLAIINSFQTFELPWLLTNQGGPNRATLFYNVHLFQIAFVESNMGKASAMAWLLFVVIILFTIGLFRATGRFVYYGGR